MQSCTPDGPLMHFINSCAIRQTRFHSKAHAFDRRDARHGWIRGRRPPAQARLAASTLCQRTCVAKVQTTTTYKETQAHVSPSPASCATLIRPSGRRLNFEHEMNLRATNTHDTLDNGHTPCRIHQCSLSLLYVWLPLETHPQTLYHVLLGRPAHEAHCLRWG